MYRIALPLLFALAACSEDKPADRVDYTQPGAVADGDMYVDTSLAAATNLVPWLAGENAASSIAGLVYNSLLKYDKNLNITGSLAYKWDVGSSGKTLTFHLRKNITWHDGEPFTAHDVKATLDALTHPETRTPYAGDYALITVADVVDNHTFRVTYREPFAPALSSWVGLAILPAHILKLDADVNETRLKKAPVGTGPYILEKWDAQTETVLRANPDYFEGKPPLDRVRIRVIPDLDAQFLELKAGRIDSMNLKPVQFVRLTDQDEFTRRYAKYNYLGFNYTYLGFNLKHPLFKDKRVRLALSHATPRRQLVKGILHGQGEVIASVFKPGTWAYHTGLQAPVYDLDKAKALLKEAGWTDNDGDGIVEKEGRPLAFTVITNQGNDQRIKTGEILQHAYRQIGVDMQLQVQEWRTFLENTLYPRNFEAFILGWALTPEPDPYDIWHSSKQKPREFNIIGFESPAADALMEQARRTFDQTRRKALLDKFQEILHEEQPTILLYAPYNLLAVHRRFKGIEPAPAGISYNFEKWYVPAEQQLYTTAPAP
jgi:peptide/nickel transport system substrate-binding protein